MPLFPDYSLQTHHTLAIPAKAQYFIEAHNHAELIEAVNFAQLRRLPILILGQGSNVVFTQDFCGVVIKNNLLGIEIIEECDEYSVIKAGAGEAWQHLVDYSQRFHLWGLENLTGIPGTVGAAPIQNIGAYGVELADFFVELQALDIQSKCIVNFDITGCHFSYRDSIFKHKMRGRCIILSVTLKLQHQPRLVLTYQPLKSRLNQYSDLSPQLVEQTVRQMRSEKLPDPLCMPNVGSFFKNPLVSIEQYDQLRQQFPELVAFSYNNEQVKLAAGWLIEHAGWKGYREAGVGVHDKQALVLVNYDKREGNVLLALAKKIQTSIKEKYDVQLEIEPSII